MAPKLIISCEHGGNDIPSAWQHLFCNEEGVLNSHEGYDAGALSTAQFFAQNTSAEFFFNTTSRLLVDCNRSRRNPRIFSRFTRKLSQNAGMEIREGVIV